MKLWIGLFLVAITALVWVGSGFVSKVVLLHRLSNQIEGTATQWGVLSFGDEKHQIFADYKTELFSGRHIFKKPTYKTYEAAEGALEGLRSDKVQIWYRDQVATLEHEFPMKEAAQTGIVAALFGYFIFLRRYVNQF
jgi:hypothetical protein